MPSVDFYSDSVDEEWLVRRCFAKEMTFVPDLTYDSPLVTTIRTWSDYLIHRSSTNQFFVVEPEAETGSFPMFCIEGNGWNAGKYAIRQHAGVPSLGFFAATPFEENGQKWIGSGFVSARPYMNLATGKVVRVPRSLKQKFHAIERGVHEAGHLVQFECFSGGPRSFWILPSALQAIGAGAKLVMSTFKELAVLGLEQYPDALAPPR